MRPEFLILSFVSPFEKAEFFKPLEFKDAVILHMLFPGRNPPFQVSSYFYPVLSVHFLHSPLQEEQLLLWFFGLFKTKPCLLHSPSEKSEQHLAV